MHLIQTLAISSLQRAHRRENKSDSHFVPQHKTQISAATLTGFGNYGSTIAISASLVPPQH